jgi:hypothetical protein
MYEFSVPGDPAIVGYVHCDTVRFCGNGNCPDEFAGVGWFHAAVPDVVVDPFEAELELFDVVLLPPDDPFDDWLDPDACVEPDDDWLPLLLLELSLPVLLPLPLLFEPSVVPVWLAQPAMAIDTRTLGKV